MAVGSVSIQSLLKTPYVIKVISRQAAVGTPLQSFYNVGFDAPASMVLPAGMRGFVYDIFDHTRLLASIRAPEAGPMRARRQRVGQGSGHLLRSYEAMTVTYEQIANMRPLGASIGTLDRNGQSYVTKQISYQTEKMRNLREWCLSRMFRGSFTITLQGDNQFVSDSGGQITVDFKLPAANTGACAAGSGANIFGGAWQTTTTDVIIELLNLSKAAERQCGLPIRHAWINSTCLGHLINNVPLQNAGGASFRVWESMTWRDMPTTDGSSRQRGQDVVFRAIPWITFHVHDGVLHAGSAQVDVIPATSSDVDLVIPNGKAIFTPDPGPWLGYANGTEIINKLPTSAPEEVRGFSTWQRPTMDPYGRELLFIDNFFPVPFIPTAWYYATVHA